MGKDWSDFDSQRTRSYFLGFRTTVQSFIKIERECDRRRVDRQTDRSENITSFFGGVKNNVALHTDSTLSTCLGRFC